MKQHKLNFSNRTIPQQLAICRRVAEGVAKLTPEQRAVFAEHDVGARTDEAEESVAEAEQLKVALKAALIRRNQKVQLARSAATFAASGISLVTGGEPVAMLAAGLDLVRAKQPAGLPGVPEHFRGQMTEFEGRVKLRWQRPVRRCSFAIEATTDPSARTGWKHQLNCFKQKCEVRELVSGQKYWFRVAASNAHGQGPWSQVVSVRVK